MNQPSVVAVMLTADRPAMAARAVRCWQAQDYPNKRLMILDSGKVLLPDFVPVEGGDLYYEEWCSHDGVKPRSKNIGALRNDANSYARALEADIIIHWDDDDWSAPTRISDQVKLLIESGKQAVGYREMLFWQNAVEVRGASNMSAEALESGAASEIIPGEAWLYRNTYHSYCIATSLCYWRRTWEAKPFPDQHIGSENEWQKGLQRKSVVGAICDDLGNETTQLVATIHGSNTVKQAIDTRASNPDGSPMWVRVPNWDDRVRSILEA